MCVRYSTMCNFLIISHIRYDPHSMVGTSDHLTSHTSVIVNSTHGTVNVTQIPHLSLELTGLCTLLIRPPRGRYAPPTFDLSPLSIPAPALGLCPRESLSLPHSRCPRLPIGSLNFGFRILLVHFEIAGRANQTIKDVVAATRLCKYMLAVSC